MFITIITPCSRPENIEKIAQSINIPMENFAWFIVYDRPAIPEYNTALYEQYGIYNSQWAYQNPDSISGNDQRNYALDRLSNPKNHISRRNKGEDGWIYFNDDDTTIHPDLWDALHEGADEYDFIHFAQEHPNGEGLRLDGAEVKVCKVDSHNFLFKYSLLGDTRWILNDYCADGHFAEAIYKKAQNPIYVPRILSTYNSLR